MNGHSDRELLIAAVTTRDRDRQDAISICDFRHDPAWWVPVDLHAFIVHPSLDGDARWTTEADVPGLAWMARNKTAQGHTGWAHAVAEVLRATQAPVGARYRLLDAVREVVELVRHERTPSTTGERLLVENLGSERARAQVVVVTSREDESLAPAQDYVTNVEIESGSHVLASIGPVVVRAPDPPNTCSTPADWHAQQAPRLSEWLGLNHIYTRFWQCDDRPRLTTGFVDGYCRTHDRPLLVDEMGFAACRVEVTTPVLDPCPESYGWLDPVDGDGVRRPREVDRETADGARRRVCEVRQLEGKALLGCRNTVACDGCEPGWCASAVWPELIHLWPEESTDPPYFWKLRFVLGADSAQPGTARITCNLGEPSAEAAATAGVGADIGFHSQPDLPAGHTGG